MRLWGILWMAAAALLAGQPALLTREGPCWVETANGSVPRAGTRLWVSTHGRVRLQGGGPAAIAYTLKKRVCVAGREEAARRLRQFRVSVRQENGGTRLGVWVPEGDGATADLTLRAPRGLLESVLESRGGTLEAFDLDGAVVADTAGGAIRLDRIWGGATARTGGGEIVLGHVRRNVKCISAGGSIEAAGIDGEAWLETAGGEISIGQAEGAIHASTAGGNIRIGRAARGVEAQTAGGSIQVREAGGMVTAETSGGAILIAAARGVRCESAAGSVVLHRIEGAVRASTALGNVFAELMRGARIEDSFLSSGHGDVTVWIPSNLAVTVRARSESNGKGRIVSDFPEIPVRPGALAEGGLNGGGPLLRVEAANGTIYLRRQK